jgi:hypothetical protein
MNQILSIFVNIDTNKKIVVNMISEKVTAGSNDSDTLVVVLILGVIKTRGK